MFAGIKAPHINGIMGLANHCFALYISDWKQYTLINGFNSDLITYMVNQKVWFQVVTYSLHILVVYYGQQNIPKYTILQMMQA